MKVATKKPQAANSTSHEEALFNLLLFQEPLF